MSVALTVLFTLSCVLALVLTYALWVPLRKLQFKTDMLAMALDLKEGAKSEGAINNPEVKDLFRRILLAGRFPDAYCVPSVIYLENCPDQKEETFTPTSELTARINEARIKRLAKYVFFESASGWIYVFLVLAAFPKREKRHEIRRGLNSSWQFTRPHVSR